MITSTSNSTVSVNTTLQSATTAKPKANFNVYVSTTSTASTTVSTIVNIIVLITMIITKLLS